MNDDFSDYSRPWTPLDDALLPPRPALPHPIDYAPHVPARTPYLGKCLWKGRQWVVTADGLERHDGHVYYRPMDELLSLRRKGLQRISNKIWVDRADLSTAVLVAHGAAALGLIGRGGLRSLNDLK